MQTIVIHQLQSIDKMVDVPVLRIVQVPQVQSVEETLVLTQLQFVEQTVVIPEGVGMPVGVPTRRVGMPVGVPTRGSSSTG